ncbi:MAG: mevalonate kinase [Candidatus Aminicenantales bacterium]
MTIKTHAFARAGLLGNPSDGYYGKIIAVTIKDFRAEVTLGESEALVIVPQEEDRPVFSSLSDMAQQVSTYGYYGGIRLVKAAIKKFLDFLRTQGLEIPEKNFTVSYACSIPRQLGLGGSSAIITAVMRALIRFYGINIPKHVLPTLILEAERKELGIHAGFMDRVVQVYEGCVYMDLDRDLVETRGYGRYESLDPALLPPLYLAYKPSLAKVSGRVLDGIRAGYDRGDPFFLETLHRIASLAEAGRKALLERDWEKLHRLMDENFDLRSRIMDISPANRELIQTARRCGVPAKFAGSGGSIIGFYRSEAEFRRLAEGLKKIQARVIKPKVA